MDERIRDGYFFVALIFAHLALVTALIRASPAGEIRRLGAIDTTFWPRVRAQRAFCEAEILARAAALILRGPCDTRVLFNPLSALIAVSSAFTCCAALSRSAFNCAIMSMCSSPGEDCTGDQAKALWSPQVKFNVLMIQACGTRSLHHVAQKEFCLAELFLNSFYTDLAKRLFLDWRSSHKSYHP